MAATQGLLLLFNSTIGAVQQPQGLFLSYNNTLVYAEQARIRPKNIEPGTNGVGKAPFGLKLCPVRAVHLRMPPTCLDCTKKTKINPQTWFSAICGSRALPGPISQCGPLRCRVARSANYTCCGMECASGVVYACHSRLLKFDIGYDGGPFSVTTTRTVQVLKWPLSTSTSRLPVLVRTAIAIH